MKDEYSLLNNVEIDLSQYMIEEVSELEKKKMMKKFMKSKSKRVFWDKKKLLAAVAALFLVFNLGVHGDKVLAAAESFKYNIDTWLRLDSGDKYSTKIGETLQGNNTKLTLNEFFTDSSRVIINFKINKGVNETVDNSGKLVPDVYIDGKKVERSSDYIGYAVTPVEGKMDESNAIIEIEGKDLQLSNKEHIKLVFAALAKECGVSDSEFTYSFDYDGTSYKNASKVIKVNKDIIIGESKLSIGEVTVTPDRVLISGTSKGFSGWETTKNVDYYYDIVDENNKSLPMKEQIGKGAFYYRSGDFKDVTKLKIIPYTFNKIANNTTDVDGDGRTKYILEDKIITVELK
ncbi:DUF4179 domain-containing protein [Clostridium folliculivorans]|uniref:DUF4179 domain-containing protein n=1 Tax=Clostridium folliculivorans TaxID=2886038 RepID=A0A9W5Y6K0_9CLOT|nr:DUF4179 domain-containing protein [Clostridium folliculivorans]GKU27428.1 hypothetical protein CFOLD11_42550 [Clostridium folliculivorans]GKU32280.1 hypothetical protein CFB3_43880 [Clostridium folliculivorans]